MARAFTGRTLMRTLALRLSCRVCRRWILRTGPPSNSSLQWIAPRPRDPRSSRPRQDCETAGAWGAVDPPVPLVATGSFARGTRKHGNLHAVDE